MPAARSLAVVRLEDRWTPAAADLDPTFGAGGLVQLGDPFAGGAATALAAQPDGGLVFATQFPYELGRLRSDGRPDPAFGVGGRVSQADLFPGQTVILAGLAAQPDGRVVAAGGVITPGGATSRDLLVTRLRPDGTPDPTFGPAGGGGLVRVSLGQFTAADAVTVLADGRVVVVGETSGPPSTTGVPADGSVVVRLTADGRFDPTFHGGTPAVVRGIGQGSVAATAVRPADGQVTLLANSPSRAASGLVAIRVAADGSGSDPGFGTQTYTVEGTGEVISFTQVAPPVVDSGPPATGFTSAAGLAVGADGSVAAGYVRGSSIRGSTTYQSATVVRLDPTGKPAAGFGTAGRVSFLPSADGDPPATDLTLLPDGRVVVAGETFRPDTRIDYQLTVVGADGRTVDTTPVPLPGDFQTGPRVAVDAAQRVLLYGLFEGRAGVVRLQGFSTAPPNTRPMITGPTDLVLQP